MKLLKLCLFLIALGTLAACGPGPGAPTIPANPTQAPASTQAGPVPGELVQFSGDDSAVSDSFQLEAATTVDISWEYSGSGAFALWLVNDTEDLADPSLFRILLKQTEGSTTETAQYRLEPGDYHLEVELAGGPWTVLVKESGS